MGIRGFIIVLGVAALLLGYGWSEWTVSSGASEKPEAITIEELEKGPPANPHRILGAHYPVAEYVIFSKKNDRLEYVYYPATSEAHADAVMKKVIARHKGDASKVTPEEFVEALEPKVLIKSDTWKTEPELEQAMNNDKFPKANVAGLVTNKISTLSSEEKQLLRSRYKNFNADTVVIFESGRTPSSTVFALGTMGAGAGVLVLGIVGGIMMRRAS